MNAVEKARNTEPKWHPGSSPLLVINAKTITRKEGLMGSIAAEREELEI